MNKKIILFLCGLLILSLFMVLPIGRYPVSASEIINSILSYLRGENLSDRQNEILMIFFQIRLPRIIGAILVGSSLSISGAVYQGIFLNPLVSPGILGVLSGASTGAAIGIVVFSSWPLTQLLSFFGGLCGVGLTILFSKLYPRSPMLALLVGGLVSSSFFTALTSIFKYVADPQNQLPELVYWLMGTLSRTDYRMLLWIGPLILLGLIYLIFSGKNVNALSLGDEEAKGIGIDSNRCRLKLIGIATMICSLSVILAGIINWVGLVIPHILRLILGSNNQTLLPASALGGAIFVLLTDTLVRSIWTAEFPLSIFTSLICLPLFAISLRLNWRQSS